MTNLAIHAAPLGDVYRLLDSQRRGLTQAEAAARLRRYGPNTLREEKGKPLLFKLLSNFTHLMAILLWVGGAVAFVAQLPQLGWAVWAVNVINGVFSFWQDFKAEKATAALRRLLPTYARVLRDGLEQHVPAEELVPGDVMLLNEGDNISADGRLVQEAELSVNQSTLSGESYPVRKTAEAVLRTDLVRAEIPNLVFAGTGQAVIFATGMNTEFGKIAHLTQSLGEELSPLQKEINIATRAVSLVAIGVGVAFFILAVLMAGMRPAEGFIFCLGMIVAFIPEGLLPTVTLALAMGVQRMARRNALVKRLSAVETLGCTTTICTDKTGTLTQNEMTVRNLWLNGRTLAVTGIGYNPEGAIVGGECDEAQHLLRAAALCNNARLLPPNGDSARWAILGDPTEAALKVAALKARVDPEVEAQERPRRQELPFDSRRKRMSTIHQDEAGLIAYVKGAPKEMLALCTQIELNGQAQPLSDRQRAEVMRANDEYARNGLRVLAIAERRLPDMLAECTAERVEQALTLLGLAAMMDPPRSEVSEAVEKCHRAGIRIIMITGDYGLTAESIARRIGVIQGNAPRIITGTELDELDDEALQAALQGEVLFARVSPEHKLRVTAALQALGHVVAMTGDGVNDAPALKKADIGVAMGVSGTDVAKEAADMILTDDNFASIVNAVEEGRAVYANIKKFTSYIFTSNAPEAVPFIFFALSSGRIPLALNVMQILAVDLGTDMVPALALGTEAPEPGIMERPPRNQKEHVITWSLLARSYLWLGPVQGIAAMLAFYFYYWTNGYRGQWLDLPASGSLYMAATAMTLGAIVTTQIGNLFAQRTERLSIFHIGFFSNRLAWVGIATELLIVVAIIYIPVLQRIFGTAAFAWQYWLFLLAWSPALLIMDEIRKAWLRRKRVGRPLATFDPLPLAGGKR